MDNMVFEKTAADYCAVDVDPNTPGVQKRPACCRDSAPWTAG